MSLWVKFSLQCGLFSTQEVSYNISNTNWNCLQLPLAFQLWWVFFSLGIVFVLYIPHLLVAITQREECRVFTVAFTVSPPLWELSLQQKLWRAGKETCSHSVQLWKLLWMQISFIESSLCWMPVLPSIVKATLSYLHGKAAVREGFDLLPSLSPWGFNLQLRKKPMEICLKL